MNQSSNPQKWMKDFNDFLNSPEVAPPAFVSEGVKDFVSRDLNPTIWNILSRLALVHIAAGTVSLLVCSQFGIGRGHLLAHAFMSYGETVCIVLCGALFLGISLLVASFLLSSSELKAIRKLSYSPVLILGLLSLSAFFCLGADISLKLAMAWMAGGLIAGVTAIEAGLKVRQTLQRA